jgi:hypothetical protein
VIPTGSRFDTNKDFYKDKDAYLLSEEGQLEIAKVKALTEIAEKGLTAAAMRETKLTAVKILVVP